MAGDVRWNCEMLLLGQGGKAVRRLGDAVQPDAADVVASIEAELASPAPVR